MNVHAAKRRPQVVRSASELTQEDVMKIYELIKGSTSVELKVTVPDTLRRGVVERMKFDPVEAEPRTAYFFDTPDLALSKAGIVVRARRFQGGGGDTVIKLRPVDPTTIDPDLRRSAAFKIELDAMPGGYVCSASFKGECTGQEVLDVVDDHAMPLSKLFSKEQREFFKTYAPPDIALNNLVALGPTFLLKARHQPKSFDRRVTIELWLYPDGSRIFELSTKAQPKEGFQVAAEFKAYLSHIGVPLEASQDTKTKSALAFFSKRLAEAAAARRAEGVAEDAAPEETD